MADSLDFKTPDSHAAEKSVISTDSTLINSFAKSAVMPNFSKHSALSPSPFELPFVAKDSVENRENISSASNPKLVPPTRQKLSSIPLTKFNAVPNAANTSGNFSTQFVKSGILAKAHRKSFEADFLNIPNSSQSAKSRGLVRAQSKAPENTLKEQFSNNFSTKFVTPRESAFPQKKSSDNTLNKQISSNVSNKFMRTRELAMAQRKASESTFSNQLSKSNDFKFNTQRQPSNHSTSLPSDTRKILLDPLVQNPTIKFRASPKNLISQRNQSRNPESSETPQDQVLFPPKRHTLDFRSNLTNDPAKNSFIAPNIAPIETASVIRNSSILPSKNILIPPTRSNLKHGQTSNKLHALASITPRTGINLEVAKQLDSQALQNQNQTQIDSNVKQMEFLRKFKMLTFFFWDLPPETIRRFQKLAETFGAKTIPKLSLSETTHLVTDYSLDNVLRSDGEELTTVNNRLRKFKESGGKIWTSEKFLSIAAQVKKCIDSRKSLNEIVAEEKLLGLSTSSKPETQAPSNYHLFTGHYLLVEESSAAFRPILAEEFSAEKPYPMFWIKNPVGHCGFVEYVASEKENDRAQVAKIKIKQPEQVRPSAILRQAINSNASGLISGSIAALRAQEIAKTAKLEKIEQRALHIQTKRSIKRKFFRTKPQKATGKAFYKKSGFCENCNVVYDEFIVHVKSEIHKQFAQDNSKFKDLDIIINTLERKQTLESNSSQDCTYSIAEWEYPKRQNRKRTNSFCRNSATSLDEEFPAIQLPKKREREETNTNHHNKGISQFIGDDISLHLEPQTPFNQELETEKIKKDESNISNIYEMQVQDESPDETDLSKIFDEYNNDKPVGETYTKQNQSEEQFEDFAVEEWTEADEDKEDVTLWEDNWDKEVVEDEFTKQLRAELMKQQDVQQEQNSKISNGTSQGNHTGHQ
ncbi:hypothetical protein HK096_001081 [Nowakowskiella sp. JEL0078]|nr:hypothetical protein HK096_001081 [Nowakowskiella sp. JEL0078]